MRTLAITQNVTLDGSIEMLGDWFDPQGQGDVDSSDLLEIMHREDAESDAFLVGRSTFEDMRGYWPQQTEDTTGVTAHLNQVQKYVISSTLTEPDWQNTTVLASDVVERVRTLKEQPGRDIVVTGSITLCHTLIKAGAGRPVPAVHLPRGPGPRPPTVPRRLQGARAEAAGCKDVPPRRQVLALRPSLSSRILLRAVWNARCLAR